MNTTQKLATGLLLISDIVEGTNFYNSENTAFWKLKRNLTDVEKSILKDLGFELASDNSIDYRNYNQA